MKIYISGRITGIDNYIEVFHDASKMLAGLGYIPVDPCTLEHDHDKSYESYMKEDVKALLDCEMIYMLDYWTSSKGATFEHEVAMMCGIKELKL